MFGICKLKCCKRRVLSVNSLDIICIALQCPSSFSDKLFYSAKIYSDMIFLLKSLFLFFAPVVDYTYLPE